MIPTKLLKSDAQIILIQLILRQNCNSNNSITHVSYHFYERQKESEWRFYLSFQFFWCNPLLTTD